MIKIFCAITLSMFFAISTISLSMYLRETQKQKYMIILTAIYVVLSLLLLVVFVIRCTTQVVTIGVVTEV